MYSQWYFEYALLDRVYDGLIAVNPYDLAADIPWAAQDWEVGTWLDPRTGTEKTAVTYWLRQNSGCAEPVNGTLVDQFDSRDYIFTCWYNYAFDDDWQWISFMDINHIEIGENNTVKVYFDDVSMWFVYAPVYPLLGPKPILEDLLCEVASASFTGADLVESPPGYFEYQFTADQVVQVINATVNGEGMWEDGQFYIRAGYDTFCHNVFVNLTSFAPTDVITIYYTKPIVGGAGGTYLGGNLGCDWTDTMYAYGYMYPVSISSTSAALNRNPYFHMETVPKGEIDFRWNYVTGSKPRDGFFKIDILDVVKCTGAYCTRGDGVYNTVYLPGADLDDSDVCHIGILDLVTITGKYALTFGRKQTIVSTHSWNYVTVTGQHTLSDYASDFTIDNLQNAIVTAPDSDSNLTNGYQFKCVKSDPSKAAKASGTFKNSGGRLERWSCTYTISGQGSSSHEWQYAGEYTLPDYQPGTFVIKKVGQWCTVTAPDTNPGKQGGQFKVNMEPCKNPCSASGTFTNTDGKTETWKVSYPKGGG
jgi:hypothetical protein